MAGSSKEAAEASKVAEESSNKPKDLISPGLPKSAVAEKEESKEGRKDKTEGDPLRIPYSTVDYSNESKEAADEESKEDPFWMFYDTDDSSYYDSLDEESDDEPKAKKLKKEGEASVSSPREKKITNDTVL